MLTIIDYGMGNPSSISNMIRRVGGEATITSDPRELESASALILPGVGAFDNAMEKLHALGMIEVLRERILGQNVLFLGICLGMQLLFEASEEGINPGLGFLPGTVRRLQSTEISGKKFKVPHMGWNTIEPAKGKQGLFIGLESEPRFYFVHSYHVVCQDSTQIAATCDYGYRFTCAVEHKNIYAVQFHPEKSHRFGMQLFRNFIDKAHSC